MLLDSREHFLLETILKLHNKLNNKIGGIPLSEFYKNVRGIYQSDKIIAKKLKKFERLGLIKIENWSIVEVKDNV